MHAQIVQPTGWLQYLLPVAVFAVIFAFRIRRMSQERPLKLERLWIVPAIYLTLVAFTFAARPPSPWGWLACAAALAVGGAIGWWRGKSIRITVDPATHRLNQRASPVAMLLLLALVGTRLVLKEEADRALYDPMLAADLLMALALGVFTVMRIEMYLRGKRLLDQAVGSPVA